MKSEEATHLFSILSFFRSYYITDRIKKLELHLLVVLILLKIKTWNVQINVQN